MATSRPRTYSGEYGSKQQTTINMTDTIMAGSPGKPSLNTQSAIQLPGQVVCSAQDSKTNGLDCRDSRGGAPVLKNRTLERESKGCYSLLFHTSVFVFVDVWRQITAYGMKYYNNDIYPVAQTQIVAMSEFLKLFIFVWKLLQDGTLTSVKMSTLYFYSKFYLCSEQQYLLLCNALYHSTYLEYIDSAESYFHSSHV